MTVARLFAALHDGADRDSRDTARAGHANSRRERRGERAASTPTWDHLADRVRAGDRDAFAELYVGMHHELTTFLAGYAKSWSIAEELVQEVFLRLWVRRQQWRITTSLRAYLFGAARNIALNAVAHGRVELAYEAVARAADAEMQSIDIVDADEPRLRALQAALLALPERQRSAVTLRYENDLTYEEIGVALGISKVAARNLVMKGEARLRQAL